MNANPIKPDSPIRIYLAIASALLLVFTMAAPHIGITFASLNFLFLGCRMLLKSAKPGERCVQKLCWGIALSNVFLLIYVKVQNFIPYWNYADAYIRTLESAAVLRENIPEFFRQLHASVFSADGTVFPVMLTGPLLELLGGSYSAYILLNFNIFIVPFYIVFGFLINDLNPKCVPLMFLFTPFLAPVLCGAVDGAGLLYVALWLYLIYRKTFRKKAIKQDILMGIFSVLLVFSGKQYFFLLSGICIAAALTCGVRRLYDKHFDYRTPLKNIGIIAGIAFGVLLLFFSSGVISLFQSTPADTFSAYGISGFWDNIKHFIGYYGILVMAFCALGLLGLRKRRYRQFVTFLLFQLAVTFLLFASTHALNYQFHYLFAASLFVLIVIGISALPKYNKAALLTAFVLLVISAVYSYLPFTGHPLRIVLSGERFAPKITDTASKNLLADKLNKLTEEGGEVYVLAGSDILNDDILRNSKLPVKTEGVKGLLRTHHVDVRDGIPNQLFLSKFIVVTDPVQVPAAAEGREVIQYFARELLDGKHTPNLECIDSVKLSETVTAYIYRKNAGYTEEFLQAAQNHFHKLYPENRDLFEVDFVWSQI